MSLVIEKIQKRFGDFEALRGVSLTAPDGAFVALLGPSGSGKTTLLRILGGLEHADLGHVGFAGLDWLTLPARERRAGFVFQQYALFKHMTVAKNIAFGLEVRPAKNRPTPRRDHAPRRRTPRARPARKSRRPLSQPALRRPAPARRPRPRSRHRA